MPGYAYQLLLKRLLLQGVSWAPDQEILYRDQVRLTYRSLYDRILRLGSALIAQGVSIGSRIGVLEWDSHRYLEMYFGIPGIGAVLHTVNPGLAPEQILYTLQHAEDEVLIFHQDFIPLLEKLRPSLAAIKQYILIRDDMTLDIPDWAAGEYEELLFRSTPLAELPDLDENNLATISYTSGTTGKPKGVAFTQRQLTLQTLCDAIALAALGRNGCVNKHTVYMPLTPLYHSHAWGMPYVATMLGLKQVYPGRYQIPLIIRLLQEEKVTFSHCVPTILKAILGGLREGNLALPGWNVIVGGAAMSEGLARAAAELGIYTYGGYGLSENCPILTIANLKPYMENWGEDQQLEKQVRPGFPIPLVDLRVVNSENQDVRPDSTETGEVIVRTPWSAAGYLKDPEGTEALWEGGWLHTGDVAVMDEHGYIKIVDRLKDIIKSGGEWIVSQELESYINQCAGVGESAVIGVHDEKWGERPVAIVTRLPGHEPRINADAILTHLKELVQAGKLNAWAIPDQFIFVDELPKTSVGKIDKKLLRGQYTGSTLNAE